MTNVVRRPAAEAGAAEETLAFVSELVADQLSVEAIHRLYHDTTWDELVEALDAVFRPPRRRGDLARHARHDGPRRCAVPGRPER